MNRKLLAFAGTCLVSLALAFSIGYRAGHLAGWADGGSAVLNVFKWKGDI